VPLGNEPAFHIGTIGGVLPRNGAVPICRLAKIAQRTTSPNGGLSASRLLHWRAQWLGSIAASD
jgi:hypothetical protein